MNGKSLDEIKCALFENAPLGLHLKLSFSETVVLSCPKASKDDNCVTNLEMTIFCQFLLDLRLWFKNVTKAVTIATEPRRP